MKIIETSREVRVTVELTEADLKYLLHSTQNAYMYLNDMAGEPPEEKEIRESLFYLAKRTLESDP